MIMNDNTPGAAARITMPRQFDFTMYRGFMRTCTPLLNCASVREIEVELSEVDYLDNFALDMLILLKERVTAVNKSMLLLNISDRARQRLEQTHLGVNIRYPASALAHDSIDPACIAALVNPAESRQAYTL